MLALLFYSNVVFLVTFQISPPKSAIGSSCMWNCLCWKVYHCYPTGPKAKFAECPAGPTLYL